MWAMLLGAFIMFLGIMVGVAISERGQDRAGGNWRQN